MSDFTYKVDVSEFVADLQSLAGIDFDKAIMAGGLVVEAAGKENIIYYDFIDTGATLNSTAAKLVGDEAQIGPETEYAIFGELGIGQSEKPFMREALEQNKQAIAAAVAAVLRDELRRKAG